MGYTDMYKEVEEAKSGRSLSSTYVKFEKVKQQVIGRLINKNAVTSTLGGKDYNQYLMDTDDGLVKFSMGRATDVEAGSLMNPGGIYCVKYLGTEKIKGGRQINNFEVTEIEPAGDHSVGGEGDVPF